MIGGKYGFGKCHVQGCKEDAAVGIQDRYVCLLHFDLSMKRIGEELSKATETVGLIDFHVHAIGTKASRKHEESN